ncbi:single insulin-like growth factor-binding domain protein-2 [Centruroides vittatus]|uniref:single insulin-like growth factor-binding domain protein-2 n=1 Tax=Centruroides vittatus TaxID=120091 RepID=UPI00350F5166
MRTSSILLIFIVIASTNACDFCYNIECQPPPEDCSFGTVLDGCGCCQVCAKGEGESCGGAWDVEGICAEGLICMGRSRVIRGDGDLPGICRKKEQ